MEELKLWCENLILSVIAILLIELLIPESMENKKYIKVISGIFLMFMVLNPFIEILDGKRSRKNEETLNSNSYERKICAYCDQRVAPDGVVGIKERLEDAKVRYKNKPQKNKYNKKR